MGDFEDYSVKPFRCPSCRHEMHQAMSTNNQSTPPEPGDVTICIRCAALLKFNSTMGVRLLRRAEMRRLRHSQKFDWAKIEFIQRVIRMRA